MLCHIVEMEVVTKLQHCGIPLRGEVAGHLKPTKKQLVARGFIKLGINLAQVTHVGVATHG